MSSDVRKEHERAEAYDRAKLAGLAQGEQLLQRLIARKVCPVCLDGLTVKDSYTSYVCPTCNGRGYGGN